MGNTLAKTLNFRNFNGIFAYESVLDRLRERGSALQTSYLGSSFTLIGLGREKVIQNLIILAKDPKECLKNNDFIGVMGVFC